MHTQRTWWLIGICSLALLMLASVKFALNLAAAQETGSLTRITNGFANNRYSFGASVSADGTRIVFLSDVDLLNQGIQPGQFEIWLYDTRTLTFTRITSTTTPNLYGYDNVDPRLNADGEIVAFASRVDWLGQRTPGGPLEIWLYDTATLRYTRITTATGPNNEGRDSILPVLSTDGKIVAYESHADLLGQGAPVDPSEIWLYDTATLTYTRVTSGSAYPGSMGPSLSADGTRVAFMRDVCQPYDGGCALEIWLYDSRTLTVTRVTTASAVNRGSWRPSLSADGARIAFKSDSDFLGQDIPENQFEIWLYDTASMTVTRITHATAGARTISSPSLSADGTKIAFNSDSDFLGQGIPPGQEEIWLYDTAAMTLTRITTAGSQYDFSFTPSSSADGKTLAFHSNADFWGEGIPTSASEIWLYEKRHRVYLPLAMR